MLVNWLHMFAFLIVSLFGALNGTLMVFRPVMFAEFRRKSSVARAFSQQPPSQRPRLKLATRISGVTLLACTVLFCLIPALSAIFRGVQLNLPPVTDGWSRWGQVVLALFLLGSGLRGVIQPDKLARRIFEDSLALVIPEGTLPLWTLWMRAAALVPISLSLAVLGRCLVSGRQS